MKTMYLLNRKPLRKIRITILFACLFFLPPIANAQEEALPQKTLSPYFEVISGDPALDALPLKSTNAEVNIVGVIADVIITQSYRNEGSKALEAIYTFPASTRAAIYAMEMQIGDRRLYAKIEEKNKARAEYNQAKAEGKRTSLLEQDRPNVFRMNVANIMPGDEIEVVLKYTEMLIPEAGTYEFVFPTVIGPRYSEGSSDSRSGNDEFLRSPYQQAGEQPHTQFNLTLTLNSGVPVQQVSSPSHKIETQFPTLKQAKVKLAESEKYGGNRDFILHYDLSGDQIESGLMLYEHEDENFFMLMVQPPKRVDPKEIPPREYIFVVDVSGSMRGFPIQVTKTLLRNLVTNLRPADRFNIMVFAGTSGLMAPQSLPANMANVAEAIHFIDNHEGSGGTRLYPALQKALELPRASESLSRSIVIVTDGYISVEKEVFDLIRNHCDQANTFVFGIGSSVNRHLIEGMAHTGHGEPLIILNEEEAHEKAEQFREYISNPVLTQVRRSFSGIEVYDVEPKTIPDVLAERPVIIYGKYQGNPEGKITLKGKTANSRFSESFDVSEVSPDAGNSALRYLWARQRIRMLDDFNNIAHSEAAVEEVTKLGLKYNLMTAYTSFLCVDEQTVNDGTTTSVKQALPMPQHVPNSAMGFEMEIEEENFSFFFHKALHIETDLPDKIKQELIREIESNFIIQVNLCFSEFVEVVEVITVLVDEQGSVKDVIIEGEHASAEMKQQILMCALQADFSQYNLGRELKFSVTF